MDYPILDVPVLGGSLVIAIVAIVHVLIAHFAVGAGLFNAVHEGLANRRGDATMLAFLRTHSRFIILFPFVAGALTGVGIWVTIATIAPVETSNLIHLFVWGWAMEWALFIVEIAAGYVYYYTWDRLPPRVHNAIGWIYAIAALGSLVLINGIISFMLTPGANPTPESFWQNLFNPSFGPSTFVRTISGLALAVIFVIIVVNYSRRFTHEQRHHVIRLASPWLLPLILMVPLAWWYFNVIPPDARNFIFNQSAMVMVLLFTFGVVASIIITAYAFLGIVRGGRYVTGETGFLLLAIALIATGSMEFVREGIRKPYLNRPADNKASLFEGLYPTELTPSELRRTEQIGTLTEAKWFQDERASLDPVVRGRAIFRIQCSACHTADGAYNPVKPLVHGWTAEQFDSNLMNLHATKDAMPHYHPTKSDRADLAAFAQWLNGVRREPGEAGASSVAPPTPAATPSPTPSGRRPRGSGGSGSRRPAPTPPTN
jgi:mono/diheme cytochrome c family protein